MRWRRPAIEVLFRADRVPDGRDQPMIGAVADEAQARAVESRFPGRGVCWETIRLDGPRAALADLEHVWVLVDGGASAADARLNPTLVKAFTAREYAEAWQARAQRQGDELRLWRIPFGTCDIDAPDWAWQRES